MYAAVVALVLLMAFFACLAAVNMTRVPRVLKVFDQQAALGKPKLTTAEVAEAGRFHLGSLYQLLRDMRRDASCHARSRGSCFESETIIQAFPVSG